MSDKTIDFKSYMGHRVYTRFTDALLYLSLGNANDSLIFCSGLNACWKAIVRKDHKLFMCESCQSRQLTTPSTTSNFTL